MAKSLGKKVSCIILAAGTSSRMGSENKLLLPWGEKQVVDVVIDSIAEVDPFEIIVVTSELTVAHFAKRDNLTIVENPNYMSGMTSSIKAGVNAADTSSDGYMICLGDQPTIKSETYLQLLTTFSVKAQDNRKLLLAPYYQKSKGNPVVFSSWYKQDLLDHEEPEGCKQIIQSNTDQLAKLEVTDESILLDLDTPEKYQEIKKRFLGIG